MTTAPARPKLLMFVWCAATAGCFAPPDKPGPVEPTDPVSLPIPRCDLTPAPCTHPAFPAALVQATQASDFIFRGTVAQLDASTVSSAPPPGLVTVRVTQELSNDGFNGTFLGKLITVSPVSGSNLSVGTDAYFFTNQWLVGDGLAVTEVTHVSPGTYANIASDVAAIDALIVNRALYDDLVQAEVVAIATVRTIGDSVPITGGESEHDPTWTDATIAAECSLRDARYHDAATTQLAAASPTPSPQRPSKQVIRFAASHDIAWWMSPKPVPEERAIFILHHDSVWTPTARSFPGTITGVLDNTLDVQPTRAAQALADLLACPPTL